MEAKCAERFSHSIIDMGTCSLQSVHGAVKYGVKSTSWGIKDILKCGFNLLHNLPARREGFRG